MTWQPGPAIHQLLCLLSNCSDATYTVSVSTASGTPPLLSTAPAAATGRSVSLALLVPIPAQTFTTAEWTDLGRRAAAAGIHTVNRLADHLDRLPSGQSIFGDWPLAQRQNALAQLESAFLDPTNTLGAIAPLPAWQALEEPGALDAYTKTLGERANQPEVQAALADASLKLDAFAELSDVDWEFDPNLFAKGAGSVIISIQGNYQATSPSFMGLQPDVDNSLGYRDYLRQQWTSMITLYEPTPPTLAQAELQLRNRLHQDFTTSDTTQKPPNEILIPILTEILEAGTGATFGFGVPAAAIPARGAATARQYLDTLVGLTKVSAQELSLRYRTDFTRPDSAAQSTAIWENLNTLLGFFRDSFQSVPDPAHADPDVLNQTIIPTLVQGKAPFFLEFDEWVQMQQPIPFENYVQIRQIFQMDYPVDVRNYLTGLAGGNAPAKAVAAFFVQALAIYDALQKGYQNFDQNEFKLALVAFNGVATPLLQLLGDPLVSTVDVSGGFAQRRATKITSLAQLNQMLTMWNVGRESIYEVGDNQGYDPTTDLPDLVCALVYLAVFGLPTLTAQAALASGNYADAIRPLGQAAYFLVGKATIATQGGWRESNGNVAWSGIPLYSAGDLPYTVDTVRKLPGYPSLQDDDSPGWGSLNQPTVVDDFASSLAPGGLHALDRAFYRLQMGDAMLDWADALYRADQPASTARARELYKGVYYLYGGIPPINPSWQAQPGGVGYFPATVNPALASQFARAELGFTQIEAGLNFFGYTDDMVPTLRYTTLKAAADAFAADAKSAERDFLNAMSQIENAIIDDIKNSAMIHRAALQVQVAQQQAKIASDQVTQAQVQVAQVNQQIQAAQQQVANHDSFFGQLGDYLSGMASLAKGATDLLSTAKDVGTQLGADTGGSGSLLGLSGDTGAMAGFAAFAVTSYITLSSMADAQSQREKQVLTLESENLPSAFAQLDIAQRSVTIAELQQQIAQSDADLAASLLAFGQDRFLSSEFWSYMAALFERTLRRYLDLGAATGWLAQRALSYEQDAPISIMSFDYFRPAYLGAGGADQLQLDLANLEARHLSGLQEMVPLKLTYSLTRDFPLQFSQLQANGTCLFQTSDAALRLAYPGMFGFRVLDVTPRLVRASATAPIRGVLVNSGVSQISLDDGTLQPSVRPADGLPISEFDIGTSDMSIFGLPGATLMQFEGSGIETIWQLVLPAAANPGGLASLADVLITVDLRAHFSYALYQTTLGQPPTSLSKLIVISAARHVPAALTDLQNKAITVARIPFDLTALGLPAQEKTRTVNNLFVVLVGAPATPAVAAQVSSATPAKNVSVSLTAGVAYSNAPPITDPQSKAPPSPLNALAGIDANQILTVTIDKSANPNFDFTRIADVILGVDYTATL
jgi:hypothetical protein